MFIHLSFYVLLHSYTIIIISITFIITGKKDEDGGLLTLDDINSNGGFMTSNFMAILLFTSYLLIGKYLNITDIARIYQSTH